MPDHSLSQNADGKAGVHAVGFDDIYRFHMEKSIDMLNNMVDDNDPMMKINCALRDNHTNKATALMQAVPSAFHCSVHDLSQTVTNKSRMRIAFLASRWEHLQNASPFMKLCNQAVVLGHDTVLFSHARLPKDTSCSAAFFLAHPSTDLCGLVPAVDAVIADSWSLAPQALRTSAALTFFLADHSLYRYPLLDQRTKNAIRKAYGLPMRIVSFSHALTKAVYDLFGRDAAVLPIPADTNAFVGAKGEEYPLFLLIAANSNDAPRYVDALGALSYLRANGIEYRIQSVLMRNGKEPCNYDLEMTEQFRPSRRELLALLKDTDIYLDLSHDDFLSYEIINALASGCVSILPHDSVALSRLRDGHNCLLFDPQKPPGIGNILQRAAENQDLRRSIAQNGRRMAKSHTNKALGKSLQRELSAPALQAVMD